MSKQDFLLLQNGYDLSEAQNLKKYFPRLDYMMKDVFPNEDMIRENLIKLRAKDISDRDQLTAFYMPFNTRDVDWMSAYIYKITSQHLQLNNMPVPFEAVRAFVTCSEEYNYQCNAYERNIVKCYIELLKDSEFDSFKVWKSDKKRDSKRDDYDNFFYQKVSNAMRAMRMPEASIERGLELNAGLWREDAKKIAFENTFSPMLKNKVEQNKNLLKKHNPEIFNQVLRAKYDLYEAWSQLRDYQYYANHKEVVDKTYSHTPGMRLGKTEARILRDQINDLGIEYEYILFEACMEIEKIQKMLADEKKLARANCINQISNVVNDEEVESYWDTHQPINNTKESIYYDIRGKQVITQARIESEKYWDTHQPDVSYDPRKENDYATPRANCRYDANGNLGKPQSSELMEPKKRRVIFRKKDDMNVKTDVTEASFIENIPTESKLAKKRKVVILRKKPAKEQPDSEQGQGN